MKNEKLRLIFNFWFFAVFGGMGFSKVLSSLHPGGMLDISRGQARRSGRSPRFLFHQIRRPERAREIATKSEVSIAPPGQIQFPVWSGGCAQSWPPANIRCSSGASRFQMCSYHSTENS